ncbi:DUF4403 family protein [Sphingomonas sp. LT1P40]|uniref:DUF4403 family protein n=1 Tax=Alteristakelama amylovorans TaxID=3096166 RepID=UPI002FCCA910
MSGFGISRRILVALALLWVPLLASCDKKTTDFPVPPRLDTAFTPPKTASTLNVPVRVSLDQLQAELNRATPQSLWSIDERRTCVAPARVTVCLKHVRKCKGKECRDVPCKIGVKRMKVTPDIACRIVGRVTRGQIRLGGSGETITLAMPVRAVVQARDVGGIIRQETATGGAMVRATVRLGIDPRWEPVAKVDLAYNWTDPPGIDILGQRIDFAKRADKELVRVIAGLERSLPRSLPRGEVRALVAGAWRDAFTTIELNRERPPAWMRVTPDALGFGGYRLKGRTLEANVAARAFAETFVGDRPANPKPTPLPPPLRNMPEARGLRVHIPVLADYAQLEPVLKRALDKLARKKIELEGLGEVKISFGKVTLYPTSGGRIAVGIEASADLVSGPLDATRGEIWLTGIPVNAPGSEVVRVRDLKIFGRTDREAANLLISYFLDETVVRDVEAGLVHDFKKDYDKVLAAARKAIAERREGDFLLRATIDSARHGAVKVTGSGLYMPTEVQGSATIVRVGGTRR